jgi:hypothetical protein
MTEIVFQESMYVLYLLVKIHKTPKRQGGLKQYYRNGSCQIGFFSVGLKSKAPSRSTLGIPGIVDIGAKPKKV